MIILNDFDYDDDSVMTKITQGPSRGDCLHACQVKKLHWNPSAFCQIKTYLAGEIVFGCLKIFMTQKF